MRHLRSRAGPPTPEALELADSDEAPTASGRAPPNAMALSYVLDKVGLRADAIEEQKTEAAVWGAATLKEAWRRLHAAIALAADDNPVRARQMREKDMLLLALCTAQAETLHLMSLLPPGMRAAIAAHPAFSFSEVEELYIHLGQDIEVRGGAWVMQLPPPSTADLQFILRMIGRFGEDGRGCITSTAHRVSGWRGRQGETLGVTIRVGRFVPNVARALLTLAERGSVLILSRAGMGKTTLLRDLAAAIAQNAGKPRVTIVDTSNEIGGDGPIPMPFLGRCRRIQVPARDQQSRVMTEVIQNHSPEYLIVDELATADEAQAAWSIAQRGVRLIATCHGDSLAGLLQNQSLNLLVGGAVHAFLSNEERRLRNKTKKTVLERPHSSPFQFVVELNARDQGYVYVDVNKAVDLILDDQSAKGNAAVSGQVTLSEPLPHRLEGLIRAQERAQHKLDTASAQRSNSEAPYVEGSEGGSSSSEDTELFGTTTDAQGYTVPKHSPSYDGGPRGDWRGSSGNGRRKGRKTDSQLLNELDRML